MKNLNRKVTVFLAVFLGILTGILSYLQPLRTADEYVTNFIYRNNPFRKADNRITLIAIDSDTVSEYGLYENWSRSLLAEAVTELSKNNAAVIGLDINLSETGTDAAGDSALVSACETAGNVVAMGEAGMEKPEETPSEGGQPEEVPAEAGQPEEMPTEAGQPERMPENSMQSEMPADDVMPTTEFKPMEPNAITPSINWKEYAFSTLELPYEELQSVVSLGISNALQQSADGSIRNAAMSIRYEGKEYDSYATAVYKLFKEQTGEPYTLPQLDNNGLFGFTSIWDTNSYQVISFQDLLDGNYDPSYITDNIVLIGTYEAIDYENRFQYLRADRSQKQEILTEAAIIQALLTQKTIINVDRLVQALVYGCAFTLIYGLTNRRRKWLGILLAALILDGIVTACFFLNTAGLRMYLLTPILATLLGIVVYITQQLIFSRLEKHRMERTLKMYVDSRVADTISEASPFELAKLSERKHVAVLFVDIRGFTSISEVLEPEQVVEILNEYLTEVGIAVARWNGTLDKFIGDAAMALFNAPEDLDDYVRRAACAAMDIRDAAAAIGAKYKERYDKEIAVGIGINCGDAIVGNIGSIMRMDYTAIGDTVNTASRLEAKAKPGQILISEAVVSALEGYAQTQFVGDLSLKGKANSVPTYELLDVTRLQLSRKERAKEDLLDETRLLYSKLRSTH